MADELQRVGIVFKADGTAEFNRSLKEVNASIQENRSAFNLAKSTWDENTKSVEKLQTTQKYLAEQTKDYTDKVNSLQKELDELENAEVRNETAIKKKKNQLNTAKTSLNNYKKGLDEVNKKLNSVSEKLKRAGEAIQDFGKKTTDVGKNISAKVTAPIMGIGAAGVAAAMELDDGYDTIITKTGATGEALEEMNDIADELFSELPIEMTDAGTAVGEVNTRFHATGEELKELSEEFLKFANINDTDLNSSIDNTDAIMKKFNVDMSETQNVLGLMTKAGQDTGISMDTLQSTLMSNGSVLKEMDLDLAASVQLLAQFEANGVDSTTALAGLKKAQQNATEEGRTLKDALGETIESIKNAETETEALQIATDLFGKKGAAEMAQAIREGRLSIDDLSASLSNYGDVVTDTFESTLDPWDTAKTAANDLKLAGAELGNTLLETLAPIIQQVAGSVKEFSEWFRGLNENQKQAIVIIDMLVTALGPLLMMLGTVTTGIGGLTKAMSSAVSGVSSLGKNATTVMNGIGTGAKTLFGIISAHPIITIITAIIGAIILLYNKCEWFRDGVDTVIAKVIGFFGNFKQTISDVKEDVVEKFGDIKTNITEKIQYARDRISEAAEKIKGFLDFGKLKKSALGVFDDLKDGIKSKIEWARDKVEGAIEKIKGFFNFRFQWPDIPLPHFSVSPPGWKIGDLLKGSVPSLGISWYKTGGILDGPTIFGMSGNNLLAGGEAGKEAVLPIELLKKYMREENRLNNEILVAAFSEALKELELMQQINVYLGDKKISDILYKTVVEKINKRQAGERRAVGTI